MSKTTPESKSVNKFKQLEMFLEQTSTAMSEPLEEEVVDGHTPEYVTPNIEVKLSKEKRQVCRDILMEIRNFGVSQRQIAFLIYLLALDLEDIDAMKAITAAVGEHRDNIPLTKEDIKSQVAKPNKKKLILD